MKIRCAINPGKSGFITVMIDETNLEFFQIPKIGKEVDLHSLDLIFKGIKELGSDLKFVIEDVHALFGSSSKATFSFGYIVGALTAMLVSNNISFIPVQPKKWQKEMWEGVPMMKKPSSTGKTEVTDTKAMSLIAAKRIFPNVDMRASERCKNPDDNKVDSLLMAEYCRRNF